VLSVHGELLLFLSLRVSGNKIHSAASNATGAARVSAAECRKLQCQPYWDFLGKTLPFLVGGP